MTFAQNAFASNHWAAFHWSARHWRPEVSGAQVVRPGGARAARAAGGASVRMRAFPDGVAARGAVGPADVRIMAAPGGVGSAVRAGWASATLVISPPNQRIRPAPAGRAAEAASPAARMAVMAPSASRTVQVGVVDARLRLDVPGAFGGHSVGSAAASLNVIAGAGAGRRPTAGSAAATLRLFLGGADVGHGVGPIVATWRPGGPITQLFEADVKVWASSVIDVRVAAGAVFGARLGNQTRVDIRVAADAGQLVTLASVTVIGVKV